MNRIIIVGGGLAGLTTAYYLSKKKYNVTLIEASPKFGGRTYSLTNEKFNDVYDNGQHIMMGCYNETLKLISDLGNRDKIEIQNSLEIPFVEEGGKTIYLRAPRFFYPVNLAAAMMNFKLFAFKKRLRVLDFLTDLLFSVDKDLCDLSVIKWLLEKNQDDEVIEKFWEILIVGTMNTTAEKASAQVFKKILAEIFFAGGRSSSMIIPKAGLTELFALPILSSLTREGNTFINAEKLISMVVDQNQIVKIITNKNEYNNFDSIVLAIPPHAIEKLNIKNYGGKTLIPDFQVAMKEIKYSPILNVHFWLDSNPFPQKFYSLVESEIHWLFNHGSYISLTTSAAEYSIEKERKEIFIEFCSELEKYFPIFNSKMVTDYKIIKEKRATIIPDCASVKLRKNIFSPFENMRFAGDWTVTDLPATIESAILSGKAASDSFA